MTNIRNDISSEISAISNTEKELIIDWLSRGLIGHYAKDEQGAFSPHDFIYLFDDPIDALCVIYDSASPLLKITIRNAITIALSETIPDNDIYSSISLQQRLRLFQVLALLIERFYCFEAILPMTASVLSPEKSWNTEHPQAYAIALACIARLAINGEKSSQWLTFRNELRGCIFRFLNHDAFKSAYAPLTAYALTCIEPILFLDQYRPIFSEHINKFHTQHPEQKELAYATVDNIVTRSPHEFVEHCPRFDLSSGPRSDKWIIEALDSPKSKYSLFRLGAHTDTLYLQQRRPAGRVQGSFKPNRLKLHNNGFIYYQTKAPMDDCGDRPSAPPTWVLPLIRTARQDQQSFLRGENIGDTNNGILH